MSDEPRKFVKYVRQPSVTKKLSPDSTCSHSPQFVETDSVSEDDVLHLYTRKYPVDNPRAVVYILHGFGEHCERYDSFIKKLNLEKLFVATHDHVGHGKSHGHRVHVDHFNTYVEDALELMKECKKEDAGNIPFIVFGHSMGGLMATLCMLEDPSLFTAGILSSPCLMIHSKYNKTPLRWMARTLSYVAPRLYIPIKSLALDPADVIADEDHRKSYEEDPLVWHYQSRAGGTSAMFDAIGDAQKRLTSLKVKCLCQHGTNDLVCDIEGVMPFKDIPDVVHLEIYEGAKHALLSDKPDIRCKAINDIIDFINRVVGNQ